MFFNGNIFWFLNGIIFLVVAAGFNTFAKEKGWEITWWKWTLSAIWYLVLSLSFYTGGTFRGENFPGAGLRALLLGVFISLVLGVGLWRVWTAKPKGA